VLKQNRNEREKEENERERVSNSSSTSLQRDSPLQVWASQVKKGDDEADDYHHLSLS